MDRRLLALVLTLATALPAAAAVTPELQRQVRAATFEVVMKKPAEGSVSYEKPLPLELLPYIERTDPYRSIGTAFALGKNLYVTAAHVLIAGIDSQYGAPALRAADGSVHSIARIEKFSAFEDFVVFSLADDLGPAPLSTNRSPHLDDPVLAVGNALGDGIVIRDGLFTSETPEEQDGRWKWIRFSAAASPGNSGGPLLDAQGNVIGVVIAKSPSENLNYALPIANVLDAPPSKARFDQRVLTKLPFAQGSRTYMLKDEIALPLSWEKFVRAYQALLERHDDEAREALLSAYASSLFPHGSGTDAILYGPDVSNREPTVVVQQTDGDWAIQSPDFQFTDLPGDGKIGIGVASGAVLLALHRGDEASDDAFYADSKSFMDIALKALNVRRPVGSDQVKVVSLGVAQSDVTTTDTYGRKWQVRVWPLPFLDIYLVAQLLPTPDGYAGLIGYAPSIGLRDTKIQLSMLANQVSLTYVGTLAQWRAFLARKSELPDTLRDVRLESGSGWLLHTRRFESRIPVSLMKIDTHSELLMSMGYVYDGPHVVWDIGGVWWYRDAQEKAYVGLVRKPRPPATAKLEMRTRFEDLQAQHSPYDGSPVQASSDSVDVAMALQAPGSKQGMASADLAYSLSMRLDGHPSPQQVSIYEATALDATHILERGAGTDVAMLAPATLATQYDARLNTYRAQVKVFDQQGKDIRGRLYSEDVDEFITPLYQQSYQTPIGAGSAAKAQSAVATLTTLQKTYEERVQAMQDYWRIAPSLVHDRDLWQSFLVHNHLPADTPHEPAVLAAESSFNELVGRGEAPTTEWSERSSALDKAYVSERARLARKVAADQTAVTGYRARQSDCPEPAIKTSGTDKPRPGPLTRSLEEFYPPTLKRLGVQGLVVLSIKVNSSGCATEAAVVGSSGADELDEAALKWVDSASFLPAEKEGKPVEGTAPLTVDFKLR
jgi:serine protease Do